MASPYADIAPEKWAEKTRELIDAHPLKSEDAVDVVLTSWRAIFESQLGGKFRIGHEIRPKPQIMGFLLHELVPLELQSRHPNDWRPEKAKTDKDLVHIPNDDFSIELKSSSHASQIFGNRSYAQPHSGEGKSKDGYYLTVNFQKFGEQPPEVTLIRFGWLDHTDWVAQSSATGQQARVRAESDRAKLLSIYSKDR